MLSKNTRIYKGKSLIDFPSDYTLIDIETTGLDPNYDEIIEIAAIRIRNNMIDSTFSTLVKPERLIDNFITELTGITNDMVANSLPIEPNLYKLHSFINNDILLGHNVNFDVNFLYDNYIKYTPYLFKNNFVDTLRLSRKVYPDLGSHSLSYLTRSLGIISKTSHRAEADCLTTYSLVNSMINTISNTGESIESFVQRMNASIHSLASSIRATNTIFDDTHPVYGQSFCFTGTLSSCTRREAMQVVVNMGGIVTDRITKKTNYLVLGITDYRKVKGNKSSKVQKAESLKTSGYDIDIISENVFWDLISN